MTQPGAHEGTIGADGHGSSDIDHLLIASARGDHAAFAELYTLLVGPTAQRVQHIVRDPAMSDEITQDVMTEVWACSDRFDPHLNLPLGTIKTRIRDGLTRLRGELTPGSGELAA